MRVHLLKFSLIPALALLLVGCVSPQQLAEAHAEVAAEEARITAAMNSTPLMYFAYCNYRYSLKYMDVDGVERTRTGLRGYTYFAANPDRRPARLSLEVESDRIYANTETKVAITSNGNILRQDFK